MSSRRELLPDRLASARPAACLIAIGDAIGGLLAFVLHAALATFEPLVRLILLFLAVTGLLTCGVYRFLLQDTRFPFWTMLSFSLSMCLLWGVYSALLNTRPRR